MEKNSIVVYDDFSASPLQVSFMNDQWWVTSAGERLQPLNEYYEGYGSGFDDIHFRFLCMAGGKVGALALTQMLGQAVENPEDDVATTLRQRVKALRRLGVQIDVKDEKLMLQLDVFPNQPPSHYREGNYSVWCHLAGEWVCLFDCDAFDTREDAEEYAGLYFELLQELGVDFTVVPSLTMTNDKKNNV